MLAGKLIITTGNAQDAATLTAMGITAFCQAFAGDNKQEDIDKYVAEEMNQHKITRELEDSDNRFFLAWHNEQLIGYAKMRTAKKPKELAGRNPMEIERIYVLQQYHDMKVGAALMNHCIEYALGNQHDVVWLGVWEHNHRAVNFYKRWGFELFGSHQFKLGDDIQTDVLMKKELSPR
jgi:ribosomal protein S18 acetylase RimI-like enzyme